MGFFDIFKKRRLANYEEHSNKESLPEIKEEEFIDNSDPNEHQGNFGYSIEFGSKLPIDIIYGFLKEDYEAKAYNDALTNPDRSFKQKNIEIIRSTLDIKFKQVALKYDDMLREIDVHIKTRSEAGLSDLVELLLSRKNTYQNHKIELETMKNDLLINESYMVGIFTSYEIGFTRGLASLSLQNLKLDNTL
jgi:hypothetical protein